MEVLIDGRPYTGELAGATLQDVLVDLMSKATEDDRAMRELLVNGRPYVEKEMGRATEIPRERLERLEVETIPARELALVFLGDAHNYLDSIRQATAKVAELFRVSDEQEANEHYLATLESLHLFLQVLQSSRMTLDLDFSRVDNQGVSAEERLERLLALIKDMLTAQEEEDWVLLADILQYDLTPELDAWQVIMPALREQVLS